MMEFWWLKPHTHALPLSQEAYTQDNPYGAPVGELHITRNNMSDDDKVAGHIIWEGAHGTETVLSTIEEAKRFASLHGARTVAIVLIDDDDEVQTFYAGPRLEILGAAQLLVRETARAIEADDQ